MKPYLSDTRQAKVTLSRAVAAKAQLSEAEIERKFWRLLRTLSLTVVTLIVLTHYFTSARWTNFATRHCESTTVQRDPDRAFAKVWSCDDGSLFFR